MTQGGTADEYPDNPPHMALITLIDAHLAFGHVALLDNTGFSLESGERIGLIGRNGAGKSSLLKILGGMEKPDDGILQFQQGLRIAFVAQEPVLNAEDPRIAKALKSGEISWQRPQEAPQPARASQVEPEASSLAPAKPATPKQAGKQREEATPSRRKKEDPIKKFVSSMVIRDADPAAVIMKDAMYAAFERWCRDKKFIPVPGKRSFAIALKNQLAVSEKNLDGIPAWINVSLK